MPPTTRQSSTTSNAFIGACLGTDAFIAARRAVLRSAPPTSCGQSCRWDCAAGLSHECRYPRESCTQEEGGGTPQAIDQCPSSLPLATSPTARLPLPASREVFRRPPLPR